MKRENAEIVFSSLETFVIFSHLRWDFVYQRPQHIVSRIAKTAWVFYVEEPVFSDGEARFQSVPKGANIEVLVPHLPHGTAAAEANTLIEKLLSAFFDDNKIETGSTCFWYYTPMSFLFTKDFHPRITVFDCMDELSAFRFAPPQLLDAEEALLRRADVVFTGGLSLYEARKHRHKNIHAFPSSIDRAHFAKAREIQDEPADQKEIPHPRLGFFGVIDERFDIELIKGAAALRPDWHFIIVGPVVKIDPALLPAAENIHYTGGKTYDELPAYLGGWDVALIPFSANESTKFISPTKTPEYLAAGVPVIATPIKDIADTYGRRGVVEIADKPAELVAKAEKLLQEGRSPEILKETELMLAANSWDSTFSQMAQLIVQAMENTHAKKKDLQTAEI